MNNEEYPRGKAQEEKLIKLLIKNLNLTNHEVVRATKEQDIVEHWDFKINGIKYDAKSIKKENRFDPTYSEQLHYVELKNVRGKLGWLYGLADIFAFEIEDYWILVDKKKLQDFIAIKCGGKVLGTKRDPYFPFRRPNTKDTIVKVKTMDLMFLASQIIKKEND